MYAEGSVFKGQIIRSRMPGGLNVAYEVVSVQGPRDFTVRVVSCVTDDYGVMVREPDGTFHTVATASTPEAGRAYLRATGRRGGVSRL